ncbi:MAG: HD-GYP domain-containing protein [Acidobacteria bacterium]|nr:HD-GYP domain-containing protein [Acidobacteriota bacterium]
MFNSAQLTLTTGIAGLAYRGMGSPIGNVARELPGALVPLMVAAIADFAVNTGLVATVISLAERLPVTAVWRTHSRPLVRGYFAFTPLGLLLAVLFQTPMRWGSVLFLLVPLLVARRAFQTAIRMQGAFDSTMKGLVAAIEAKDPYTRGHAERVSRLAGMTARAYGLGADPARHVAYAALVHDIGKLAVETRVLRKAGSLTDAEYHHMRSHTDKGLEIVSEIDLLKDVVQGIRHHHERFDGSGYPDGLAGTRIPLAARLIAVADAFDSITSSRTYRTPRSSHEALAELKACAGSQFDPKAIEALEEALEKHEWKPDPQAPPAGRGPAAPPSLERNARRSGDRRARQRLAERMAGPVAVGRTLGAEIPS